MLEGFYRVNGVEPVCEGASGKFDEAACRVAADWIADGTISAVAHEREGPPLKTDFAGFTFSADRWIKQDKRAAKIVHHKVGWCGNRQPPPGSGAGQVRIYGLSTLGADGKPHYLYLRVLPVSERAEVR